ncbi:MAG: LPS-assembly protein LptD, partial [Thermodesulfobacteriota bacterium]
MKILLWCAVAFFAWAAAVPAGAGQGDLFTLDPETPWQIEADAITYDKTAQVYVAVGDVVITKEGKRLSADCVRFDQNGQRLFADGNVTMSAGSDILTGNHMDMDMAAETGTISGGTLFLADRHFYIIGDTIRKTGPDTYTADRVSFSSCEPGSPDWQITGRDLNLTVEGYGSLHHAAFWAGPAPLVYTPYLFFPVKIRRQTGFLVPQVQYSERKWEEIIQPFFWVISDSADMTFYAHHMGRRGEKLGFEYRQVFDAASKTTAMFDFMEDRKVNTVAGDEYGYDHDRWLRPNTDRYWFRMKQDNLLGAGVLAKLDIDFVSDQDYLLEFEDGYTGFDAADRYFAETFGRDLDDADDPVRTNIFNLQKSWARHSLNTSFRWEDDVIKRRWDLEDDTVQRLPVVSFDATKQKIGVTPFFYELNSEYLYGYTEDSLRGHRADMHPRIALPGRFKNFFSFEPSLGLRETVWQVERYGEES